jgi:ornithine cyclodeaminase/alanine dehydrogenase-like protein (mu-crystallin family)
VCASPSSLHAIRGLLTIPPIERGAPNTCSHSSPVALCGICDLSEQASHNGDLVHAVDAGLLGRDGVAQLGDVLISTAEGRQTDGDITIFDSTGLAIQDLGIALAAMEKLGDLDLPMLD